VRRRRRSTRGPRRTRSTGWTWSSSTWRAPSYARCAACGATLARLRPRALIVEVKDEPLERAGATAGELRALVAACGYRPTGRVFFSANELFRRA
jgi:hypothetical protein